MRLLAAVAMAMLAVSCFNDSAGQSKAGEMSTSSSAAVVGTSPSTLPASSTTAVLPATSSTVGESAEGMPNCHSEDREIPADAKVPWVPSRVERPAGVEAVSVGGPPIDIAVGEELVWVAVGATANTPARVVGVEPSTMERIVDVELADASGVAVGEDVWVSQFWRDMLVRIDSTGAEDPRILPVPELPPSAPGAEIDNCFGPGSIAVGDQGVWFDGRGVLGLADPNTQRIDVVVPPRGEISKGGNVVIGFGYVWVDSGGSGVFRVDEETSAWAGAIEVGRHTGHVVSTMAVARDLLWVGGGNLERRPDGTIGNTLAEEGAGISTVDVPSEAVTHTMSFDNSVTLASDSGDTVVAWEDGIGL